MAKFIAGILVLILLIVALVYAHDHYRILSKDKPHASKTVDTKMDLQGSKYNFSTQLFSQTSPWNTKIEDQEVDPKSASMLTLAAEPAPGTLGFSNTGLYINTHAWVPAVVSGGKTTKLVCRQRECNAPASLPVPVNIDPDPRYDGWFTIVYKNHAYDLWRARRLANGTLSYQYAKVWNLDGTGYSSSLSRSARGSGLPLIAGLLSDKELQSGVINHALAIALPGVASRTYTSPASGTDGVGDAMSLPEGARIRLKDNVVLPAYDAQGKPIVYTREQRRIGDAVLLALKTYGAIVVEQASVPTLYATSNTNAVIGNELRGVMLSDFDVMKIDQLSYDPPLPGSAQ